MSENSVGDGELGPHDGQQRQRECDECGENCFEHFNENWLVLFWVNNGEVIKALLTARRRRPCILSNTNRSTVPTPPS